MYPKVVGDAVRRHQCWWLRYGVEGDKIGKARETMAAGEAKCMDPRREREERVV